ncbi:MAG: ATP-binding cassette domain-containing protein [Chloroflexi bacterium]|nr:MAG: ATP-binding cassette domain-containing protein [Chloroflexota bacterium]
MIELTHLQKVVEQTTLIDIDALRVGAGEITAVTGLTGPHKQAFLDLLTGKSQPTAGSVSLAGHNPVLQPHHFAQKVGILPTQNGLYMRLTVRQNLKLYAELYGLPATAVENVLVRVGLTDRMHTRVDVLSPGLARRLALGRALLHQPDVLLLVDPFLECDETAVTWIIRLVTEIAAKGKAVLVIAHESADIVRLSHQIVIMEKGKPVQWYAADERRPQEQTLFRIPAKLEGKVALINPVHILYAMAEDGQTLLVTENGRIPTHLTLSDVEKRLARSGFFRTHRSFLVNLQYLKEIISYTRNSFTLILENGSDTIEVPLSKGAAKELRDLLDY